MTTDDTTSSVDIGEVIQGPFESDRSHDSWWWERPNNGGDLGYNRPDVLLRCARIWGGRVKVIRMVERSTTTVHLVTPSAPPMEGTTELRRNSEPEESM